MNGYDAARAMARGGLQGDAPGRAHGLGAGRRSPPRDRRGFDLHYTKPLEPSDLRRIVAMKRPNGSAVAEEGR